MGVDYDGGMIVGREVKDLHIPDTDEMSAEEWIEDQGLSRMSPWYDCDLRHCIIGYEVEDVEVSDMDVWLADVRAKAEKFEALFGVKAMLIGTQNIW
jgi:hypothetical protein